MDSAAKELWQKVIHELEQLNRTLNSFLKIAHRPRQQDNQTTENTEETNREDDTSGRQILASLHLGPSPKTAYKPNEKWYQTFDGWKSRIELLAFVFAIGYAVVTYFQWRDSRHNFLVDERAWLAVDPPTETGKGVPFKLTMPIRNTGKTPAKSVAVKFDSLPFLSNEEPKFIFKGDPLPFGPNAPNAFHVFAYNGQANEDNEGVPDGYIQYAYGSVAYQDVFTGKHWITYCFFKQGTGSYAYCTNHNDIGDGEAPSDPVGK